MDHAAIVGLCLISFVATACVAWYVVLRDLRELRARLEALVRKQGEQQESLAALTREHARTKQAAGVAVVQGVEVRRLAEDAMDTSLRAGAIALRSQDLSDRSAISSEVCAQQAKRANDHAQDAKLCAMEIARRTGAIGPAELRPGDGKLETDNDHALEAHDYSVRSSS